MDQHDRRKLLGWVAATALLAGSALAHANDCAGGMDVSGNDCSGEQVVLSEAETRLLYLKARVATCDVMVIKAKSQQRASKA